MEGGKALFKMQKIGTILLVYALAIAQAQDFLLYGFVDIATESISSSQIQLSVQIGSYNWQQPLKWRFYAFKTPNDVRSEGVGLLSLNVYTRHGYLESLWTEFFVIPYSGGALRLDIRHPWKTLHCGGFEGKAVDSEAKLEAEEESYAVVPFVVGDMIRYSRSHSYSVVYSFCCPQYKCQGKGEDGYDIIIPRSMAMLPEGTTILQGDRHVCLRSLVIGYLAAQLVIRWLQSRIHKRKSQLMTMMEWSRGGDRKEGRKRWEMSTYYTVNDENENEVKMNNSNKRLLVSGQGIYEEAWAWADAEHRLTKLNANCCFYFNCTTTTSLNNMNTKKGGTSTAAAVPEGEGPWNRDAFGRLIRN
ncbi:hypothetical protein SUGI_0613450 [Cryptomeria japonica]|uniref:uncharacterized protein LOC131062612 n=1 Tax=Cryptomeria japonica TaxID=3369 RepID=UPI002414B2D7|nr:uncharacterized protein LOC131062612 [Cryptomeria japonica]GLJ30860.1 hypothetical protein SUGI_0613450 [Cryptomeria japonica]